MRIKKIQIFCCIYFTSIKTYEELWVGNLQNIENKVVETKIIIIVTTGKF